MRKTKKFNLVIRNSVYENIEEIFHYIAFVDYRPAIAKSVVTSLQKAILKIGKAPFLYKIAFIKNNIEYRYLNCKNFIIYFKIINDTIEVVIIIHASRSTEFIINNLN